MAEKIVYNWDLLEKTIKSCKECSGMNIPGVTQAAPGYGNKKSNILIIGQSLCYKCMFTQIPFTEGSGILLDWIFENSTVGVKKNIFITNVVKCHPPGNRPSTTEEKENCLGYLAAELDLLKPKLIIPLGADSAQLFLGKKPISDVVYKRYYTEDGETVIVPFFHPAYIARQQNKLSLEVYVNKFTDLLTEFYVEYI